MYNIIKTIYQRKISKKNIQSSCSKEKKHYIVVLQTKGVYYEFLL